ncbi:protein DETOXIFICATION 42 [Tanacetum coccineum]
MAEKLDDGSPCGISIFFKDARLALKMDELGVEIAKIALPAALALTADPIASLVDTAFIGQIGAVELAAVGVSIAVFNQVSRIAIFPLVSITTSFVAEEDAMSSSNDENMEMKSPTTNGENKMLLQHETTKFESLETESLVTSYKKKRIPSASSALIIGGILGFLQAAFLIMGAKPVLGFMGIKSDSPMLHPALQYLKLRSLGAPAVLLSLAMQGVFRGFKDTKTPLYATGDLTNIILDPIFMFVFGLGVSGAAIAHVISQYLISIILLWRLIERVDLVPPNSKHLQFGRFLKNGFLLLMRVMAVTFCVTLAASMAARQGSTTMAAFQICLQVWLTTSLLADGLAVAGQAILASAFAKMDYEKVTATASRVLQDRVKNRTMALSQGNGLKLLEVHLDSVGNRLVILRENAHQTYAFGARCDFDLRIQKSLPLVVVSKPPPLEAMFAMISKGCSLLRLEFLQESTALPLFLDL